jgi:hypothetical protein
VRSSLPLQPRLVTALMLSGDRGQYPCCAVQTVAAACESGSCPRGIFATHLIVSNNLAPSLSFVLGLDRLLVSEWNASGRHPQLHAPCKPCGVRDLVQRRLSIRLQFCWLAQQSREQLLGQHPICHVRISLTPPALRAGGLLRRLVRGWSSPPVALLTDRDLIAGPKSQRCDC